MVPEGLIVLLFSWPSGHVYIKRFPLSIVLQKFTTYFEYQIVKIHKRWKKKNEPAIKKGREFPIFMTN